ncbi:hypothetical protein M0P25_04280 [archaeon]|nr:hypothetical protein [archaeon]
MTTVECSNCGQDSAYYNGVCFECPDCGYEWEGSEPEEDDEVDESYY